MELEKVVLLVGGLSLFLYAISTLSDTIKTVVGNNAEKWVLRFTGNLFTAILTGVVVTFLLDSSSAVIIISIGLINARLLTFRQAMGIVLGANIGTALGSLLLVLRVPGLESPLSKYLPFLLIIGLAMTMFLKQEKLKNIGNVLISFGMLFLGFAVMDESVSELKKSDMFNAWMQTIGENKFLGTLTGGIVTLVVQSSSATVGMAVKLGTQNLISLAGAIGVMMGAELGTVSDTLLATINGSRQAIKTGLFHFFFNLLSIIAGFILFTPFESLILKLSAGAALDSQIAYAHILFNLLGVVIFVWFVPLFERGLNAALPEKEQA